MANPIPTLPKDAIQRFWASVRIGAEDECWEWLGSRSQKGYGLAVHRDTTYHATRIAYALTTGDDPGDRLVCHSCDNPPCCNPRHLWLGTAQDNSTDCNRKGRRPRGMASPWSKLNDQQILAILADTRPQNVIAKDYGISRSHVSTIQCRRNWLHLGDLAPRDPTISKRNNLFMLMARRGEKSPNAKLTDAQVAAIRVDTRSRDAIAAEYKIHPVYVSELKRAPLGGARTGRKKRNHP